MAGDADESALRRLAGLDSQPLPTGRWLLAEVDGTLRAAYSIEHGRAIADPFHRTARLVALLEEHGARSGASSRARSLRQPGIVRRAPWPA